ncbi:MAG: invasion associated locus B family protein [Pseudomonadota bacterium]
MAITSVMSQFRSLILCVTIATLTAPLAAKSSLGVYSNWATFRDDDGKRCYAIAKPRSSKKTGSYASLGTWPELDIRNQLHIRLSQAARAGVNARLRIGGETFELATKGRDAWAKDARMDAAITAALRSASQMRVSVQSANGGRINDRYSLSGVATAMDASIVGCAGR